MLRLYDQEPLQVVSSKDYLEDRPSRLHSEKLDENDIYCARELVHTDARDNTYAADILLHIHRIKAERRLLGIIKLQPKILFSPIDENWEAINKKYKRILTASGLIMKKRFLRKPNETGYFIGKDDDGGLDIYDPGAIDRPPILSLL